MFRKVAVASMAAILIGGVLTAAPASAATKISNGVPCSKAGATTKVSGFSYKCAKNTLVKNSKLTWLSVECISSLNMWAKAKKDAASLKDNTAQLALYDSQIAEYSSILETVTAAYNQARIDTLKAQTDMNAAPSGSAKQKEIQAALKILTEKFSSLSASKTKLAAAILSIKKARITAATAPTQIKEAVVQAKEDATTLCTKGY